MDYIPLPYIKQSKAMNKAGEYIRPEQWLKEICKPNDWDRLEEGLNDVLWTNNVIKYMDDYSKYRINLALEQVREKAKEKLTVEAFKVIESSPS